MAPIYPVTKLSGPQAKGPGLGYHDDLRAVCSGHGPGPYIEVMPWPWHRHIRHDLAIMLCYTSLAPVMDILYKSCPGYNHFMLVLP